MQGTQVPSPVRELDPTCHNSEFYMPQLKILNTTTKAWRSQKKKKTERKSTLGNSLVGHWLGLRAFTAEGMGSVSGQGTKILFIFIFSLLRATRVPEKSTCAVLLSMKPPHKQDPKWASVKKRERVGVGGPVGNRGSTSHPCVKTGALVLPWLPEWCDPG